MPRRRYSICSSLLLLFGILFFCGSTARAQAVDHDAALAAYRSGNAMSDGYRFAEAAAAYEHAVKLDPRGTTQKAVQGDLGMVALLKLRPIASQRQQRERIEPTNTFQQSP